MRLALRCAQCSTELPAGAKFCPECGLPVGTRPLPQPRFTTLESYTPTHRAEKILTSKSAIEGERKQVTVLFADLKGSMELLADRNREEARPMLDPVLERMIEAVHRYEGTVNQVLGDGIMALANKLGMHPLAAHCHLGRGPIYSKTAHPEHARAELSAAIELYRGMEMTFWRTRAEAALAEVQ
jgi:class 3 adenylate cyclase